MPSQALRTRTGLFPRAARRRLPPTPPPRERRLASDRLRRKGPEAGDTLGAETRESPSWSVLEEGRGDVTITANSLNKQINSGQSSARRA